MPQKQETQELFHSPHKGTEVLTDEDIEKLVAAGHLIDRNTFDKNCVEACSYDIRIGRKAIIGGQSNEIDLEKTALELQPGSYAAVISLEKVKLSKNILARIGSKRYFSYEGIILLTGSIVDPGYEGHLLFGLYNASSRRVVLRMHRKICNVIFERLAADVTKPVSPDPDLLAGNFPDEFLTKMANMEVLPWMQISERVKQIEHLTSDVLDLKARYDDVLEPIRKLTSNVEHLTNDVSTLTAEVRSIAGQVGKLDSLVMQNAQQISQAATCVQTLVSEVGATKTRTGDLMDRQKTTDERILALDKHFGMFRVLVFIFWALLLLVVGAYIKPLIDKAF